MNYSGVIIEESLTDKTVLKDVIIISTEVEPITPEHKTPWLKQWTLHNVEVPEANAEQIVDKISKALESERTSWYADFKNDDYHYIIFPNKVFKVDRTNPVLYKDAREYGISLGIPEYQVDFHP